MERMTLNGIYKLKYFDHDTFHIENVMCDNFSQTTGLTQTYRKMCTQHCGGMDI